MIGLWHKISQGLEKKKECKLCWYKLPHLGQGGGGGGRGGKTLSDYELRLSFVFSLYEKQDKP